MKTIRAKQAKVYFAYFVGRDEHGIIAKHLTLTQSDVLLPFTMKVNDLEESKLRVYAYLHKLLSKREKLKTSN